MESRITLKSNLKIIFLCLIITILFAGGILLAVFVNLLLGIVVASIMAYVIYVIYKYLHELLTNRVITSKEDIRFILPHNEEHVFLWEEITHAGMFKSKKGKETLFIYKEPDDKLMSIGQEFTLFNSLKEIIRKNTNFLKLSRRKTRPLKSV